MRSLKTLTVLASLKTLRSWRSQALNSTAAITVASQTIFPTNDALHAALQLRHRSV
jgi:hypothetical protein